MKSCVNIFKTTITMALAALLVAGCAKFHKDDGNRTVESKPAIQPTGTRFDPLELEVDKTVVPKAYPQSGAIVAGQTEMQSPGDTDSVSIDTTVAAPAKPAYDTLNSQAFRVQLYTTKQYGDARYQVRVAEEIFDRPVYLEYEVPYFKVRVGSFADRDDADEYLMAVKSAGYTDAWVVAVTVNVQEATPLYESTGGEGLLDSALVDSLIHEYEGQ